MKKLYQLLVVGFLSIVSTGVFGQAVTLLDPNGDGGFETGPAFADNNWTVVNAASNAMWQIGTAATGFTGSRGAFIGPTSSSYTYSTSTASTSHMYRTVTVPAGASSIKLDFILKSVGEANNWDQLLVYTAPTTFTPVNTAPTSNTTSLTGATLVFSQTSTTTYAAYTAVPTITLPNSLAGTSFRLIFTWKNDGGGGSAPPAAVDNIKITYCPAATVTATVSPTTICTGNTLSLTGSTTGLTSPTYSWTGPTGSAYTSTALNPSAFTATSTSFGGIYTLSATVGTCVYTATTTSVTANATPTVTPTTASVCSGRTTALSVSPSSGGAWSSLSTSIATVTTAGVVGGVAGTGGNVTINYTRNGCVGAATVSVTPTPSTSITGGNVYCTNTSGLTMTATGIGTSFTWAPSASLNSTTGGSVVANPTAASTTYTVVASYGTCTASATNAVSYHAAANMLDTTLGGGFVCVPGTTPYFAVVSLTPSTIYANGGTYATSDASVATVDVNFGMVYGVAPGNATITYSDAACAYSVSRPLRVYSGGFSLSISPSAPTYCTSAGPLTLTATATGASPDVYLWTNSDLSPATGLSSNNTPVTTASPSATNAYLLSATQSATGCHAQASVTVTNGTPSITGGSTTVCAGSTTTWTGNGGSGTWSTSASGTASVNASTGAVTGVAAGTATITFTITSTGCYATRDVTVNPLPILSATPSAPLVCGTSGVAVTASGAATYTWTPSSGLSATTGATVTATPSSTTTYTITGTSALGCVSTLGKLVTQAPAVAVTASVTGTPACPGSTISLSSSVSAGYSVSSIPFASVSITSPTTMVTSTSTYTVTSGSADDGYYTYTLPFTFKYFGTNYSSVNINTNGYISFTASPTTTGYNTSTAYPIPSTSMAGGMIGLFTHDMTSSSTAGAATITYGVNGTAPNRKFVVSYNGYVDYSTGPATSTGEIILYEGTNVIETHIQSHALSTSSHYTYTAIQNASGTEGYAPAGRVAYTSSITTPEAWRFTPGTATYAWTPSSGIVTSTAAATNAVLPSTTIYTLTATSVPGCVGAGTVSATAYTPATLSIVAATPCYNVPMTASGSATSYTWAPNTNLSATTGATVTATPAVAVTYTVSSVDVNGCTSTATKTINPLPVIGVTSATYCATGAAVGIAASGAATYSWAPTAGLSAATGTSVNASPSATTVYTVTGTSSAGCVNTNTTTVTYNAATGPISGSTTTICLPGSVNLVEAGSGGTWSSSDNTKATVDGGGLVYGVAPTTGTPVTITYNNPTCGGSATYDLYVANGGITVSLSPTSGSYCSSGSPLAITATSTATSYSWSPSAGLDVTTGATVNASPAATTTYTVIGSNGSCSNAATITVTNTTPVISGSVTTLCTPQTATLTATGGSGTWSSSVPSVATVNASGIVTGLSAGTANITYTVTSTGCYAYRTITVYATPVLSVTPATAALCGGSSSITLTASGATTYSWSPATALSATNVASVSSSPSSSLTYTITGTGSGGCTATITKFVGVGPLVALTTTVTGTPVCPGGAISLTSGVSPSYVVSSIPFGSVNIASPTTMVTSTSTYSLTSGSADDGYYTYTLPFTFNYFGVNYTSVNLNTNGYISFTASPTTTGYNTATVYPIPSTSMAGGMIGLFTHDMNSSSTSGAATITYGVNGTAPNRKFIISYNGYLDYSAGPASSTGEIILYEGTNVIETHIQSHALSTSTHYTYTAIQNPAGTEGYAPAGRVAYSTAITTPEAWRFTPASYSYAWSPSAGVTSSASAATVAALPATTVYTLTATEVSGCVGTSTVSATAYSSPAVTVSAATPCYNVPMNAGGALSYTWAPNTSLSATTGATVTATPASVTTYTVTGTNANGCTATATQVINPLPVISANSGLYCSSGSPLAVTATGASTYSWSPATGLSATTGATVSASPSATTIYTVTGTSAVGCVKTATTTVTYNVATGPVTGASTTLCLPGSMPLTEAGTGGTWSSSDNTLATVSGGGIVYGVSPTSGTPVTITYNNAACGGSASYALNIVNGGFTVSTTPTSGSYCNSGALLSITASGATSYNWSPTTGLDVTTGATVNASPSATTTYTVVGTTGSCSNSSTITVNNTTPVISGGSTTVCTGSATTWTSTGGAGSWSVSSGGIATVNAVTGVITGLASGTAHITYTVTSSGCYAVRDITVNLTPTLSATPAVAAICGGSGSVTLTASGASTYSWSPSTGLSINTGATVVSTVSSTTTYTITGTSTAGCVATLTKQVGIGPLVALTTTVTGTPVCPGGAISLTSGVSPSYVVSSIPFGSVSIASPTTMVTSTSTYTLTTGSADDGYYTYTLPFTFNYFGVNYTSVNLNTNGYISFTASPTTTGYNSGTVYPIPSTSMAGGMIAAFAHDMNSSSTSGAATITYGVNGTAPNRKFIISYNGYLDYSGGPASSTGEIILYEGTNVIETHIQSHALSTSTHYTYTAIQNPAGTEGYAPSGRVAYSTAITTPEAWRFTPTSFSYAWSPSAGVTSSASAATVAALPATTVYTLTATEVSGCVGTSTVSATAYSSPVVTVSAATPCYNVPMNAGGAFSYTWAPNTSLSATTGATVTATPASVTTYTVTGTNANGCTATATQVINPLPVISANSGLYCSSGSPLAVTATGASTYSWSPATGLSATTGATVSASPLATTIYTVTGTSAVGCVKTATTTVTYNAATGPVTGASTTICLPGSMPLTEAGTGGIWSSSDSTLATVDGGGIVYGIAVTSTPVTITYNNPSCGGSATYNVNIANGGFTVSTTPTSGSYCNSGAPLSITASGATSYNWSPTAGLDVATGATVNASPSATTTYTVVGTTGSCSNSSTITVNNTTPVISGGSTTVCTGSATTWTSTGGAGSWSVSSGGIATVNAVTGVITGLASGTAHITYTVTSSGCYAVRDITVNLTPTLSATPAVAAICGGSGGVTLTASGASTYSWAPSTGLSANTGATVVSTASSTTTYTITGTSAAGCVATLTKQVGVGPAVVLTSTVTGAPVCPGDSVLLTSTTSPSYVVSSIPFASVSITSPTTMVTSTSTYSLTSGSADDGYYTYTLPFTFNYFGVNYTSVSLNTNGYIAFTTSPTTTGYNSGTVYPIPSTSMAGGMIAAFAHDMNSSSTSGAATITYGVNGTAPNRKFIISYNGYLDYSGGPASSTGEIILYEGTNVIETHIQSHALSTSTHYTYTAIQNPAGTIGYAPAGRVAYTSAITTPEAWRFTPTSFSYAWSPSAGIANSASAATFASLPATTIYTLTATEASGCAGTSTVSATAYTLPTVTIPTPSIGCAGTAMTASGATTYAWSPSAGLSATTGATVTPSATVTTTTYSVIGTDIHGCKSSATKVVNPIPVVTVTPTSSAICGGGTSTLSAAGAVTYSWTPSATLNSSTDAAVTATPGSTTVYSVVGTSAAGCLSAVKTGTVTVNPAPVAGAVSAPSGYCLGSGSPLTITCGAASGSGTLLSYNWTGPNGFSTTTSSPSVSFTPTSTAASGQYSLTVTYSGSACTSNASVSAVVTVADYPLAFNVTGGNGCSATGITVATSGSESGVSYSLKRMPSTTVETITGTGSGLTFTPVSTVGEYQVIATRAGGCATAMNGSDTIRQTPTITPGLMPSICQGITDQSIAYTPTTGAPATYSIDWNAAANTAGFTDITDAPLGSTLGYSIPATGAVGLFTGTITVSNGYCVSAGYTTTLTVYATPTMTMTDTVIPCYGYAGSIVFSGPDSTTVNYRVNGGALNHFTFSGTTYSLGTGVLTTPVTYQIVSASNPVCATTYNDTVTITPTPMMWVGGTPGFETDWNTASNWSCGFVPTATDSVTIPGTLYAPVMPAAVSATVSDLDVASGTVINLNAGSALHVTGNMHNAGTVAGNGRVILSGSSAQKIHGIGTISNLELNNSNGATIQVASRAMISSTLYLTAGTLTTNDSLELLSTDTFATARIAEIPATGAAVSGRVKTDQYVQGGYRRWRFWGHCFSDTISLSQLTPFIDITGVGGSSRGFTTTGSNAPSAYWHNPYGSADDSTGYDPGWRAFNDIRLTAADSNWLHPGQGIRLFFRGSKGEGLGYLGYFGMYTPSASTSKMIGHVNQGAVSVYLKRGTASQTLNQLSNPYPSPVDLGTAAYYARQSGQITGYAFYVWNPAIGAGGQYMPIPIGTSAPEPFYLPANTSYQVRAAYDGAHLDFQESYKSADRTINLFRAPANAVRFNIYDSSYHLWDVLSLQFNDKASDAEDKLLDAIKPAGLDFNFYSIAADGRRLAVDARPYEGDKVIPLGLNSSFQQDFVIRAESISVPAGGAVTLHDKLLNKYVDMKEGTEYRFTIGKDKATQGNERFELTLKPATTTAKGLEVSMAPNPASDDVKITFTSGSKDNVSVRIMDVSGVSIYNQDLGTKQNGVITVPMSNFAAGVYMVEITQGEQKVTKRLVKE